MKIRRRSGRIEWTLYRSWKRSRFLRACCKMGLHFMARDFLRDGYFCECAKMKLYAEQIRL